MHCLLQLWILGMTSSAQTDWFPLIWSHISPPTIPRRNSHTCSQAINCLPSPVKFSCLRGNDAGRNVWDQRSQWQVATDRPIVAVRTNDCCHVCNKHSSYSSSSFHAVFVPGYYSGSVQGCVKFRSGVYILFEIVECRGCFFITASVVFYTKLNMCHGMIFVSLWDNLHWTKLEQFPREKSKSPFNNIK